VVFAAETPIILPFEEGEREREGERYLTAHRACMLKVGRCLCMYVCIRYACMHMFSSVREWCLV